MKQFSYMLHTIFHYAPGESAAYLAVEILSCLISFLQLILLQSVVDSFLQNSLGSGIWQGVLFLGIYFLFQVLIQNGKERLQFGLGLTGWGQTPIKLHGSRKLQSENVKWIIRE